jgi:hypothetical protein
MTTLNKLNVHFVQGQSLLLAEASDLGLAVGVWPQTISIELDEGQVTVFFKNRQIQNGGWRYETNDGRLALEVLND